MANYKELLLQRETLDRQIEEARKTEIAAAIAQVRQLVAEFGLSAADCGFRGAAGEKSSSTKAKTVVAPKFRSPDGQTWTGRGKAPKWLSELEAKGRRREEFKL